MSAGNVPPARASQSPFAWAARACCALRVHDGGVVYIEFLLAFVPFFVLFLATAQLAMVAQAALVVRHAAFHAARKAIVVLDDDPQLYEGAARKVVSEKGSHSHSQAAPSTLAAIGAGTVGSAFSPSAPTTSAQGDARFARIREAAYLPLASVAPAPAALGSMFAMLGRADPEGDSVANSIGDQPFLRLLSGYALFGRMAAALTFRRAPGAKELRDLTVPFADREPVTVHITLMFPCTIPIGRSLVCTSLADMAGITDLQRLIHDAEHPPSLSELKKHYDALKARYAKPDDGLKALLAEMEHAELPGVALMHALASGQRFFVLQGEASLTHHGAPYLYESELSDGGVGP